MIKTMKSFIADDSGVTAIEYGLIAALVAVAAVASFTALGGKLTSTFGAIDTKMVVPS